MRRLALDHTLSPAQLHGRKSRRSKNLGSIADRCERISELVRKCGEKGVLPPVHVAQRSDGVNRRARVTP
jgi:hypothetical protein